MSEDKTASGKRSLKNRLKLDQEYKILKLIGTGGMAEVYKAEQVSLRRLVAIKKLKPALAENPEMLERFIREAQTTANLQHENIIQVYQKGESDGEHYIVMEYVEGMDLKTILKTSGRVPWEIAALIGYQVSQGLYFAHQRGYIHRDIKPGNIMLSFRGEVKIMDFGIVRRIDSELTQTGAFLGTPSYMAPEQLKGKGVSEQSDIFSLGVVLYEILAGEKPFKAESEQALILKITTEKEKNIRKLNPEIPRRFSWLLKKALKKDPGKRFANALEFARALEKVIGKKLLSQASEMLAEYLRSIQNLSELDRTQKTGESDSEPVKLDTRRRTKKLSTKPGKKEPRKIIGEEWLPEQESNWLTKTLILLIVTIVLTLSLILFHKQIFGLVSYLFKLFQQFF